ncbi:phytanoyl-CoA dioxygenase family protein [Mesorhizobium sp. LHD-90]|uniref:phytanoyl-CoA dioxygenase family protein n=1 Tax=Mesorhizobium sp. LHD-90 TaxID=3071414 RepID=UPI0027E03ED2|nr:phytanoyl-CoA dioxygenase family protein [Mesorhizobium sp. LHD-90]MDQ6437584.1 phytanoyl-CoA dioxygenase family protein [Mesorhizobium sp. LHD-90]
MNAFPDRILIDARNDSIQLEQIAVDDLNENLDRYLEPNWRAHRVLKGYQDFVRRGGQNDEETYLQMRAAFSETRGRSNKIFSDVLASHTRKTNYDLSKSMFSGYVTGGKSDRAETTVSMVNGEDGEDPNADLWAKVVHGAARHLGMHGYWVSKFPAPDALVQSLKKKTLARLEGDHGAKIEAMIKGRDDAPGLIKGDARWLTTFEEMYELSADPLLLSIVQAYMGLPPIFNTPVAFISSSAKPKNARELSDNAQLYHHDMHRLGFVKVFIYLTDVDDRSGPHTLVRGTHRNRPDPLWSDGRHDDAAIAKAGLTKDEVRITGKAGTVFLVDTSALHKGLRPEAGHRIMAQVQYVNSLFGRPLAAADHKVETAQTSKREDIQEAAALVRKYSALAGVRFMQNMI